MEDALPKNATETDRALKAKRMKVFITFAAGMAGLLFGLDIGVISGALPFITTHFELSSRLQEWVVSTMLHLVQFQQDGFHINSGAKPVLWQVQRCLYLGQLVLLRRLMLQSF